MPFLKSIFEKHFLDYLFPRECLACQAEGLDLCSRCKKALPRLKQQHCPTCPKDTGGHTCLKCAKHSSLSGAFYLLDYSAPLVRKLCNALKHEGVVGLTIQLTPKLVNFWQAQKIKIDLVVPVPLSKNRKRQRGYNQAELIAQDFCHILKLPLRTDLLSRVKNTKPQQNLSRQKRLLNLQDVFEVQGKLSCANVLLIDDVLTSGATLSTCARKLKSAGANKIYGLTLARGRLKSDSS